MPVDLASRLWGCLLGVSASGADPLYTVLHTHTLQESVSSCSFCLEHAVSAAAVALATRVTVGMVEECTTQLMTRDKICCSEVLTRIGQETLLTDNVLVSVAQN